MWLPLLFNLSGIEVGLFCCSFRITKALNYSSKFHPFLMSTKHDKKSTVYCVELYTQTTLQLPFIFSLKILVKVGQQEHRLRHICIHISFFFTVIFQLLVAITIVFFLISPTISSVKLFLVFNCHSVLHADWTTHDCLYENHVTFHTSILGDKASSSLWKLILFHHLGYVLYNFSFLLLCHVSLHTSHDDRQKHVPWLLCSSFNYPSTPTAPLGQFSSRPQEIV